jgi:Skp family chaperone for outer membrane proteins
MSFKHSVSLALAAAVLIPMTHARADAPTTGPSPLIIGTANVQAIFDNLDETKEIKAKLDARQQQVKLQAEDIENNIKHLTGDMDNLKKDSAQYAADAQTVVKDKIDLEVLVQTTNADIEHENKAQLKRVFDEIKAAVEKVAQSDGYDLIIDIVTPDLPSDADLDSVHPDQLSLVINQRTILYQSPNKKNDVSREVELMMNSDFNKQR